MVLLYRRYYNLILDFQPSVVKSFFVKLAKELKFEIAQTIDVPEKHKIIVRERIRKSNQNLEKLIDWKKVQDNFKFT